MSQIEEDIRKFYFDNYQLFITFKIYYIETPDSDFKTVKLSLNNQDKGLFIMGEYPTYEEFRDYVLKELKNKQLDRTSYFTLRFSNNDDLQIDNLTK